MAPPARTPAGARGGGRGLAPPRHGAGRLLAARGPCSRQSCPRRDPALVAGAPRPPSPSAEISKLPRRRWRLPLPAVVASVAGAAMADERDGVLRRPRRVVGMARERVGPPPRMRVQAERQDA
jgi:hypothetical protein